MVGVLIKLGSTAGIILLMDKILHGPSIVQYHKSHSLGIQAHAGLCPSAVCETWTPPCSSQSTPRRATHRNLSTSSPFLGLPSRILNIDHKTGTTWGPMGTLRFKEPFFLALAIFPGVLVRLLAHKAAAALSTTCVHSLAPDPGSTIGP